jgi:hypothetical protein
MACGGAGPRCVWALAPRECFADDAAQALVPTDRCCPYGTVRDRCYGHAEGKAGEDEAGPVSRRWPQAQPEVETRPGRPACFVGKGGRPAAVGLRSSNPPPQYRSGRGPGREDALACGSSMPVVTAHVRRQPAVPDAVRTQRGPAEFRSRLVVDASGAPVLRDQAPGRMGSNRRPCGFSRVSPIQIRPA